MGRKGKWRKKFAYTDAMSPEFVIDLLQTRAKTRAEDRGHRLGVWIATKKQFGRASKKAMCKDCGKVVVIMPHGPRGYEASEASVRGTPSMRGEAVFEECVLR